MRKIAGSLLLIISVAIAAYGVIEYERSSASHRRIKLALAAVQTVADSQISSSFPAADLNARGQLDELEAESLNEADLNAVRDVRAWLSDLESLRGARDVETIALRTDEAGTAGEKARNSVAQVRR